MYFLAENLPEINPVAMNYKIRLISIGQQDIVLHGQTAFYFIYGGRKTEKHGLYMRGYVQG